MGSGSPKPYFRLWGFSLYLLSHVLGIAEYAGISDSPSFICFMDEAY